MQLKPIQEQVVAVVGASSGIGRETALRFAQQGAKVVIAGRSEAKLASVAEEIRRFGGEVTVALADVTEFEQVKAIAQTTVTTYGRLDTWVHLPATAVIALFEETTPEEFQRVIDVSLMGQVYGAMAALPYLKQEGRGALIHVSSMEGRRSLPLQSAYAAAKHGVEGFLESLRVELMHQNIPISVTGIQPAVINTPFWNNARTRIGVKPAGIPPYYDPRLVADAILYTAEHPTRDFIVGDAGRILDGLQRLSPGLVDRLLLWFGFPLQRSQQPKAEDDPNNLYEPIPTQTRVDGDYTDAVIPSVSDWLAKQPLVQLGAIAGLVTVAVLAAQPWNSKE
ncbi:SDR family oxidoreductase [Desertifilum sp. FACHB-1129]|uniref:Short-chain dehydrogenase n=1 Tax=Desertifilum tharense IPPAS B-1220 TaxID=1781255 RepID=A0A1E5QIE0_9CYAN|nr:MULTISPECIES: SDR family oxidoreductase [Desertifilum]MDA0210021.1 SDR family oxidoreductase [Cyanobacteria bacterium FC1]MBD2314873.1 SDR family oxidoreductase [Desertifilum sp. FACHB-1129]MBD2320426.1 SDR family oxidoreductase [Desertifilum sp. FACHB-866]MBD2330554.1 SDR family oxidoreductase [Desertifilum sp. FACHB-868]OEJ74364.1 short-chain dehydrogenase [Desertifilum tharense IPPAS B-1220]